MNCAKTSIFPLPPSYSYGLPPKGAVPPPEWLPFTLRSKPPEELFAYTNLFMRHLYSDPKVLNKDALR